MKKSGYISLVEIMVVFAIIGLLLAVFIPACVSGITITEAGDSTSTTGTVTCTTSTRTITITNYCTVTNFVDYANKGIKATNPEYDIIDFDFHKQD